MFYIYDILIAVIFISCIITGIRRGFLRSLLGFISSIIITLVSFFLSSRLAEFIFTSFIRENMISHISKSLEQSSSSYDSTVNAILAVLPDFTSGMFSSYASSAQELSGALQTRIPTAIVDASRQIIIIPISIILFLLISMILNYVIKLILKPFYIRRSSSIGKIDGLLGGLLGGLKSVIIICIICSVVSTLSLYIGDKYEILSRGTINSTYIFKNLCYENQQKLFEDLFNISALSYKV